jgi:hypothetical protein
MSEENESKEPTLEEQLEQTREELERFKVKHEMEKKHRKNAENENSDFSMRLELLEQERQAKVDEAEAAKLEASRKSGDLEAIEKSYKDQITKAQNSSKEQLEKLNGIIGSLTSKHAANEIANEVFGENAAAMMPNVERFIRHEIGDDGVKVRYLNDDGSPSALTKEDIVANLKTNTLYANFVIGSNASGGGADGSIAKSGRAKGNTMTREAYEATPLHNRPNLRKEGITLIN